MMKINSFYRIPKKYQEDQKIIAERKIKTPIPGCIVHDKMNEVIDGMDDYGDNSKTNSGCCPFS